VNTDRGILPDKKEGGGERTISKQEIEYPSLLAIYE